MRSRGYTTLSVAGQLRLMTHVSRWLAGEKLTVAALTPERVEAFCVARQRAGYRGLRTAKALVPLREFLHEQGVLAEAPRPLRLRSGYWPVSATGTISFPNVAWSGPVVPVGAIGGLFLDQVGAGGGPRWRRRR